MLSSKRLADKRAKHAQRRKKLAKLHLEEEHRLQRGDIGVVLLQRSRRLKDNRKHHRQKHLTLSDE